jgi:DNA-binding transcriptional regulator GbsR (MarR family)
MTEQSDIQKTLSPTVEQFVLRWGDMGGQWGVNRSVAQIQALLFLSDRPLPAEDIAETLGLARSNVSNSLRELLSWKLIRRVPVMGDRRDFYEAEADLWQILARVAQGRKEREIDPAVSAIRDIMAAADTDPSVSATARTRLNEMHTFVTTLDKWYGEMMNVPPNTLMRLIKLGARVVGFLSLGRSKGSAGEANT